MLDPHIILDPEFQSLVPALRPEEASGLRASLVTEGCRDALVLWGDILVDGHNRYRICRELHLPFQLISRVFASRADVRIWIRDTALSKRNLNDDQRAMLAVGQLEDLAAIAKKERAKKGRAAGGDATPEQRQNRLAEDVTAKRSAPTSRDRSTGSRETAAKSVKVSEHKMRAAKAVQDARPDLATKVKDGDMTLPEATREVKREAVAAKLADVAILEQKTIDGVYDVIVVDPPWPLQKIERDERPNQVHLDYPTMTLAEIHALLIPVATDCHVWLWTTQRFLPDAFAVLTSWGLSYICAFVWHKPGGMQPVGLPQYNCEFALYARKGKPAFLDTKGFPLCFSADRTSHSEKPDAFYDVVRRVTGGRRLDMFNRRHLDGFEGWGKEAR
ncbi:MAG: MT-A70 family methyltransferase [Planctomycetota bacterium]